MNQYMYPLIVVLGMLGIAVLIMVIIYAFHLARRRNWKSERKIPQTVLTATPPTYTSEDRVNRVLGRIPPTPQKGEIVTEDQIRESFIRIHFPYEGECPCRVIRLGSYGVLKDVTVRCERCGQPFQFQYPL